jgi:ATP-dependent helicase HrpA
VRYTAIDPRASRQLFIQHGLVEGDYETKAEFFRHNRQLNESIEFQATKARRREWLIDPQILFDLYEARLPAAVVDSPSLDRWRKDAERQNRHVLFFSAVDLLGDQPAAAPIDEYPTFRS